LPCLHGRSIPSASTKAARRSGINVECGIYKPEISNTRAFLETVVNRGKWTRPSEGPVILDVRSIPEFKAGHPEHSYNAPYPYI
jgi:hypothetical protein